MKTKLFVTALTLGAMLLCGGLSSCGGDSDDGVSNPPKPGEETIDPVPEKLKPFVGCWIIEHNGSNTQTNPRHNIIFFQDGKCFVQSTWKQGGNDGLHSEKDGLSWDFYETTKTLAVAGVTSAQWTITSIGEAAWSGVGLGSLSNVSYTASKREDSSYMLTEYFFTKTWKCDGETAKFEKDANYRWGCSLSVTYERVGDDGQTKTRNYSFSNIFNIDRYITSRCDYLKDKDMIEFEFKNTSSSGGSINQRLLLQFVHPYSYKDVYMYVTAQNHENEWSGKFVPVR